MKNLISFLSTANDAARKEMFLGAPIMMHSIDAGGVLTDVSRFWASALGYAPEEMIGRKSTAFLTDASRIKAQTQILPTFMREGRVDGIEYDFVRKDGAALPVLMSATSVCDADGAFVRSLAIMVDHSETRAAHAALAQKTRELEQANAAKLEFLAAMSHEIRTPMNAVLGFAQLLKREPLPERSQMKVDAIINGGNVLMKLLTDLLDLSQNENGGLTPNPEPFDLHALIDEVGDMWHSSAREKGLRLQTVLDRGAPRHIRADAGRIRQVLVNLLSNAVKFTDAGAITLRVEELSRADGVSRLRFEVEDTGPGLTEAQAAQLFKPFVQLDSGARKQAGGWGLGLSICAQIADLLDGALGVRPAAQGGSQFFFELPVVPIAAAVADVPAAASAGRYAGAGLTVLVVEDIASNQTVLTDMLRELGHTPHVVEDGFAALEALDASRFDLVLMDVAMPGMDGLTATRHIRARADAVAALPIIAVTANSRLTPRAVYREHGLSALLRKPVDLGELAHCIDAHSPGR